MSDLEKIRFLRQQVEYHRRKYYLEDAPEISDAEFDRMYRELEELEKVVKTELDTRLSKQQAA